MIVSSASSAEVPVDDRGFFACPLVFGREGSFCLTAEAFASTSFAVRLAKAAVGRVMRSRKLPSTGALAFFVPVCEFRDSGRPREGRAELDGFERVVVAAGLDAVVAAAAGPSTRARDAAVGAVRREETSTGLVGSRGFAFTAADAGFAALSAGAVLALDAAVGAASEVRLAFLVTGLGDVTVLVDAVVGCGDLALIDGLGGLLAVDVAVGFDAGLALFGLVAVFEVVLRRSSAEGDNAFPPLTAPALVGSAGFISAGSSSAPVTGLSGFSASLSRFEAGELLWTCCNGEGPFLGLTLLAGFDAPSCLPVSTKGVSTAVSGTVSVPACDFLRSPSCATVAFKACRASLLGFSLKLVRRPVVGSRFKAGLASMAALASLLGILLKSGAVAMV